MRRLALVAILILSVYGLKGQQKVDTEQMEAIIANPQAQILDVRTPQEFQGGHLPQAVNADWKNQQSFLKNVEQLDKTEPLYVYCLSGGRSQQATDYLIDQGFTVYNYSGGMLDWRASNQPEVTPPQASQSPGLNTEQYDALTASADLVLVNFSATWCAPCQELKPVIDQIEEEYGQAIKVIRLDADENKSLTRVLNVRELPQLFLYQEGEIVWAHQGLITKAAILEQITRTQYL